MYGVSRRETLDQPVLGRCGREGPCAVYCVHCNMCDVEGCWRCSNCKTAASSTAKDLLGRANLRDAAMVDGPLCSVSMGELAVGCEKRVLAKDAGRKSIFNGKGKMEVAQVVSCIGVSPLKMDVAGKSIERGIECGIQCVLHCVYRCLQGGKVAIK